MMRAPKPTRLTATRLRGWPLAAPASDEDKNARGRVLVVGGSVEVPGAVMLAGIAALRAGAGKLQLATDSAIAPQVAVAMPEARVIGLAVDRQGHFRRASNALIDAARHADCVLVGPGLFAHRTLCAFARELIDASEAIFVLDAGTLALELERVPVRADGTPRAIVTPHAGEMAAMSGCAIDVVQDAPALAAARCARRLGCVTVLKGPETHLATPGGAHYVIREGDVGLGTSGSGDVLAGVIAGLAARGATPEQAAMYGVFAHAHAGRALAKRIGRVGFLARELPGEIPAVLESLARRQGRADGPRRAQRRRVAASG